MRISSLLVLGCSLALLAPGCHSPYHADRGALAGGLLGAGTGAVVGDALGDAGAGAAIGAGVGALGGAAIGQEMDEMEARNRAMIESQLGGRRLAPGACTLDDVIMMTQAGVDDQLIVNHIQAHGVAQVLTARDLVRLKEHGVSARVIEAMQRPPEVPGAPPVVYEPVGPPVIVEPPAWGPPRWHGRYGYRPYRPYGCRPYPSGRFAWGFSIYD